MYFYVLISLISFRSYAQRFYILPFNVLCKANSILFLVSKNSSFSLFFLPRPPFPLPPFSSSSHLPSISRSTHAAPLQVYICCLTGQIEDLSVHNFLPIHPVAGRQTALITDVTNKLWRGTWPGLSRGRQPKPRTQA